MRSRSHLITVILTRTIFALGIAYITLNLGRAIQTNYTTSRQISGLKQEISHLTGQTAHLKNTIVYYKSRTYQELEAKRRLGLKRPGETVVLVPSNTDPQPAQTSSIQRTSTTNPQETATFFEQATNNASTWITWLRTPLSQ